MNQSIRKAIFDGKFYPHSAEDLNHLIQQVFEREKESIAMKLATHPLIGGVVPHAGYAYSAFEAVHFYELLKQSNQHFDIIVIINPNHTGYGSGDFNTCDYEAWETPYGRLIADREFCEVLDIMQDNRAHALEHSGEVQLPLLQYFYPNSYKLVMITMNHQTAKSAGVLAEKIKQAAQQTAKKVLVIATSDFSHYENVNRGAEKDQHVIDQILRMDTKGIENAVKKYHVSACGYGPVMTLVEYARLSGKHPVFEILRRGHSGEVVPSEQVVNYASFLCYDSISR